MKMKLLNFKKWQITMILPVALLFLNLSKTNAQYCVAAHAVACTATANITDFSIVGTTLSNLGTGCTATTAQAYTIYAPSANTTANLILGQTYTFSITSPGNMILSVWIDFNQDNTFDATEWTQVALTTVANVPATAAITIPVTALAGPTGLRVRARLNGNPNGAGDACLSFGSGESEDYTITLDPGVACSGVPVAGTTAASDTTVCPGVNFGLVLAGATLASGLTFQWESSPDNINWTAIPQATNISTQGSQTSDTYYHCVVTCAGQSSTSTSLFVTTNTFVNCYCTSAATSTANADIDNVTLATLNNGVGTPAVSNPAAVGTYTDFTGLAAPDLTQGLSYPISVTQINSGATTTNSFVTVYIDFNHNGVFDLLDETYSIGATSTVLGNVVSGNIIVPFSALTGTTRMRVELRSGGSATQSACGTYFAGETEDYLVNILAGVACTAPPTAGTAVATFTSGCSGKTSTISLNGNSTGAGQTYQWQSSPDNATWTNINAATSSSLLVTITATLYYQCVVTCSAQTANSASVQVSVNPPLLCYCVTGLGGGGCSATDQITSVELVGTSLNSLSSDTCTSTPASGAITPYPASGSTTAILARGSSYTLNVTSNTASIISVWIDYDQDGIFGTNEWKQVTTASVANTASSITLDIPWGIPGGLTGMRIRSRVANVQNDSSSACINFGSGEAEDYLITIDIGNNVTNSSKAKELTIVPNPAKDFVSISFPSAFAENNQIKLFSTSGQLVYSETVSNFDGKFKRNLEVKDFAKGIYFMQLISSNGVTTKKLVIE